MSLLRKAREADEHRAYVAYGVWESDHDALRSGAPDTTPDVIGVFPTKADAWDWHSAPDLIDLQQCAVKAVWIPGRLQRRGA